MAIFADLDALLVAAARKGDAALVKDLLSQGAQGRAYDSGALAWAAMLGADECVAVLIPFSQQKNPYCRALEFASTKGHARCVELLIPASDVARDGSDALSRAAMSGHEECSRLLAPFSNPADPECQAAMHAARRGHVSILAMLLPLSLPEGDFARGRAWAQTARQEGQLGAAGMMDAFIEAKELSFSVASQVQSSPKATL